VTGKIVHNDHVAGAKFGNQNLLDIGLESETVDGSVDHERRDETAQRERAYERGRFPMPMRDADPQTFAAPAAAVTARQVGGRPGFVDEDQTLGGEFELAFEPSLAAFRDVGAILLRGVRGLFLRVMA
jgi:hypothetical protein